VLSLEPDGHQTMARWLNTFPAHAFDDDATRAKIASLIRLLRRATQDQPPGAIPTVESKPAEGIAPPSENGSGENKFDPEIVSEALWVQWTETVRRHDYSHVKLGRLAPTLQHLPTVIWHTPLRFYLDRTVAEIRNLKTHGEKRVRAVLEVFSVVHHSLAGSNPPTHLSVWLMPKFIQPVQQWIFESIARSEDAPSVERARADLAEPLVEQIRTDIGDTVAALAAERLGFSGPPTSVRQQAKKMGVTRARVYQLLDECAKVMEVRWPEGAHLLAALEHHIERIDPQSPTLTLLRAARDLFYPQSAEPMHEHDQPMVSDAMRPRHDVLDRPEVAATS